jgi:hypothetical protein
MLGGLKNHILLGVQAATQFMTLARRNIQLITQATGLFTMSNAGWRTVITGGKNILILDQNRADLTTQTGRTSRNKLRDAHKIFFPTRTLHQTSRFA